MSGANRFLGDSPLRVLLKLVVVSFLVGLVMHMMGWSPYDLIDAVRSIALHLYYTGFSAFGRFLDYLLLGAVVVVPIFVVMRILSYRRG